MLDYTFTVFTPTFNRKHTLPGVYSSLCAQTFKNFEWVIVDDGSSDGTGDLVASWQKEARFPIRYFHQANSGKHVAFNRGVKEARGELFLVFDSDDGCVPETLERFKYHWEDIPESQREKFSTITALCKLPNGASLGPDLPTDIVDAESPSEQMKYRRAAERWGVNCTDVLKQFLFPEIPGEKFIAEGIVWTRISLSYKARFINERLRIAYFQTDGLTADSLSIRLNNPIGATLGYKELLNAPLPYYSKVKNAINYRRFSAHARVDFFQSLADSGNLLLTAIVSPVAFLLYKLDGLRQRKRRATSPHITRHANEHCEQSQ